jgi:S-(hydroxymethyl)glutathione dehydrogenase/alcohol dehydrogenase
VSGIESLEVDAPVLIKPGKPMQMRTLRVDAPREGEVRVRMVASGVCHSCLHAADGTHQGMPLPIVLGDEGSGVVEAVGPGCRTVQVGDHVIISWAPSCERCRYCLSGRPVLCNNKPTFGRFADGQTRFHDGDSDVFHYGPATYGPYIVVQEPAAVVIPKDIPLEVAALVGCSVMTGAGAVLNTARVGAGASVAVFGCGGVGLNAVQAAHIAGASPIIAVDVVASKLDLATGLGATHTVDAGDDDAVDQINAISDGGADASIVAVGSVSAMRQAAESTAKGGVCVLVGAPPTGHELSVPPGLIIQGERRIVGSFYGSANPPVDFIHMLHLYRAGLLKLEELVTRRYRIDEANEAFVDLAAGDLGRGLIVF